MWLASGNEAPFYLCLAPAFTILKPWPRAYVYHPGLRRQQDLERKEMYGTDGNTRFASSTSKLRA